MIIFKLYKLDLSNKKLFHIFDSIGLVSFSIVGGIMAIESNFGIFGRIWLSFLTAVGGGVLRDISINYTSFIFKEGFYGSIAIIGGILLYILKEINLINIYSIISLFIILLTIRLIAHFKNWNLIKLK